MSPAEVLRRGVRAWLFGMPAPEVVRLTSALTAAGVAVAVAGGWGVDALLGAGRRRHLDLDLLVEAELMPAALAALAPLGYGVHRADAPGGWWAPVVQVLRNSRSRTVELIVMTPDGWAALATRAASGDLGPRTVLGRLQGRDVSCLAPAWQLAAHAGYPPRRRDRRDLDTLRRLVSP
ncbi:MAG: lincosamide nucleotidyltransferase [Actinomycetota bacterium]|jgi:lincosamide nucleotidyltransferase A/C/D/E|nr:lincosamide nucleotidyltransferase [Actinomycetota bacterium]